MSVFRNKHTFYRCRECSLNEDLDLSEDYDEDERDESEEDIGVND